jgi:hypothetical protein
LRHWQYCLGQFTYMLRWQTGAPQYERWMLAGVASSMPAAPAAELADSGRYRRDVY